MDPRPTKHRTDSTKLLWGSTSNPLRTLHVFDPLRRCRSLLHRSLLPRRHWRCSSALPIRPCMSGGINFPRGEEEEGDDATATQNNEWSMPNGRKRGLRARSEEKNHRRGTQTVHASNLKSWEPGEEVLCYFSRAHQFEVGSLLSSLGLHPPQLTLPFSSYAPFHDCHSGGASEEEEKHQARGCAGCLF